MLIIKKKHQHIIGRRKLNFHDYYVASYSHNIISRQIQIELNGFENEKAKLLFTNVAKYTLVSLDAEDCSAGVSVLDWSEIPTEFYDDSFLEDAKRSILQAGKEWDDDLFAVEFLLDDRTRLKIICKEIHVETDDFE